MDLMETNRLESLHDPVDGEEMNRYEIVMEDTDLMYIDTGDEQYSAEWPTGCGLDRFETIIDGYISRPEQANAQADFGRLRDEDRDSRHKEGTFERIQSDPGYREECTFLLLKFGPAEIGWIRQPGHNQFLLTMYDGDINALKKFYPDCAEIPQLVGVGDAKISTDDVLEQATMIINRDLSK